MATLLLWTLTAPGWTLEARVSGNELKIRGQAPGTSVTLELRRRRERFDGESGRLETVRDEELRKAAVENGAYQHAEPLGRPGVVEIVAIAEDGRRAELTLRTGTAAATVAWSRAGRRRLAAASEGLTELIAREQKGDRARRRLAAWRASGEESELPAAGAELSSLASDVEHAIFSTPGACPFLSASDGRPFRLEGAGERAARLLDLAAREGDLLLLGALQGIADEALALARGGDSRRWERAEPGLRRSIGHLRGADEGRLGPALERLDALMELGAAAAACLAPVEEDLGRRSEALAEEIGRLDIVLRNIN